jgi:hypothetical protein
LSFYIERDGKAFRVRERLAGGTRRSLGSYSTREAAEQRIHDDAHSVNDAAAPVQAQPVATPPQPDKPLYAVSADGAIFTNRLDHTVITNLGDAFGQVVFSFERHAAMRRRYADAWENSRETIPEIARDFELPAKAFERYKSIHGWTHASDPFVDEEWADGLSVDEAVEQTIESQRRAFHKKLQKQQWQHTIEDADKWRRFEQTTLEPLVEAIESHAPRYTPPLLNIARAAYPFDAVIDAPDVHFGKRSTPDEGGNTYDRATTRRLLLQHTEQVLERVCRHGRPERIITTVGNDWFHVDNYGGTTTSGTPQDMDGTPHQILWEGADLAIERIDLLRQVAPVEVRYVQGNHDRMLGAALLNMVYCWFNKQERVQVIRSAAPRQYVTSGSSLLCFTHGDGVKPEQLPMIMASEARREWGQTLHKAAFTGHLHHERVRDVYGVQMYQLSALSGSDRWHNNHGYVGARRSLAAYIVDHAEGVVGTVYAPVLD